VKCCENSTGVGRFPHKNTVFILLTFCLYPLLSHFWIHCKHPVRTVLEAVCRNSRKFANTIHPPLVFVYSQFYQGTTSRSPSFTLGSGRSRLALGGCLDEEGNWGTEHDWMTGLASSYFQDLCKSSRIALPLSNVKLLKSLFLFKYVTENHLDLMTFLGYFPNNFRMLLEQI